VATTGVGLDGRLARPGSAAPLICWSPLAAVFVTNWLVVPAAGLEHR